MELLHWENLVFLAPIGLGLVYMMLTAVGLSFGEEADLDVDADVDVGVDVDVDADADADAGHGHAADTPLQLFGRAMGLLGIGKVPLSIILMSFCFVWGAVGLGYNAIYGFGQPGWAMLIAGIGAVLGTRLVAEGISNVLPSVESYDVVKRALLGGTGKVVHTVTQEAGIVRVYDARGTQRDLKCRVREDSPSIPSGATVVLEEYDVGADVFFVNPR